MTNNNNELADVREWAESRIKSGHYPDTTGRFRMNALTAFEAVLEEKEPRTAQYMLDNIDSITNREATISKRSGETPKTYRSRVKGLLEDYLGWKADPTGFKIDRSAPAKKTPKDKVVSKPSKKVEAPEDQEEIEVWETIRLDSSRVFKFVAGDLSMKDAGRIAYALLARASDFDPSVGFNFGRKSGAEPSTNSAAGQSASELPPG